MQVVLGGKAHSQSREQTHHEVPGQKLEAVFPQPPETKTALPPKALLMCETVQSVLGTAQPNPAVAQASPAPGTAAMAPAGGFTHQAAALAIGPSRGITIKMLSFIATQ